MSVLPVWIPGSVRPSAAKRTCRPRPWACDTSLEPSRQNKLIHEKKPASRARRARSAQKLVTLTT